MGIFSGVTKAATWSLEKLGLTWVTGGATATQTITPTTDIKISISVPEMYPSLAPTALLPHPAHHQGSFTLKVPDHSKILGDMAKNMAQNAFNLVELAVAIQTIVDEEGGLRIKDQLDPYHYEVIRNALEENGDTVPPLNEPQATILSELGGTITETGLLSNLSVASEALGAVSPLVESYTTLPTNKFGLNPPNPDKVSAGEFGSPAIPPFNNGRPTGVFPGPAGTPGVLGDMTVTVDGYFPDYSLQYAIMASAMSIQGFIMQYAVSNFRNAIDTEARALVLKNLLGEFGKAASDQALASANQPQPEWSEPTGQSGVRG